MDPPLIQQLKEMEQLGSVVRVALFARKLPKRTSSEDESVPSVPEDEQPKPFDGLQAEQLEQVGTLGMIKGFTFGVSESGEEVVRVYNHECLSLCYHTPALDLFIHTFLSHTVSSCDWFRSAH